MKFTYVKTGDRVYDGPDKSQSGLFGCWNVGTLRTLKAALKVDRIEDLDMVEALMSYFVLSVRAEDHTIISLREWDTLKLADFKIADHWVTGFDEDGDCDNCNRPAEAKHHLGVEVPPTGPASTSGTLIVAAGGDDQSPTL